MQGLELGRGRAHLRHSRKASMAGGSEGEEK